MVWDVGTWEPEGDAACHAGQRRPQVSSRWRQAEGQLRAGSHPLAPPGSKGTEWLLIKHRDAYAQEPYDIDEYDYSVLTRRTLDQIAADAGAEWKSSRPASARADEEE